MIKQKQSSVMDWSYKVSCMIIRYPVYCITYKIQCETVRIARKRFEPSERNAASDVRPVFRSPLGRQAHPEHVQKHIPPQRAMKTALAAATIPFVVSLLAAPCASHSEWVPFLACMFGFLTCGATLLLVNKWAVHYTYAPATVAFCQSLQHP